MLTIVGRWRNADGEKSVVLVVGDDGEVFSNHGEAGARLNLALQEQPQIQVEPVPAAVSTVSVLDPQAVVSFAAQWPEFELTTVHPPLPEAVPEPDEFEQPVLF